MKKIVELELQVIRCHLSYQTIKVEREKIITMQRELDQKIKELERTKETLEKRTEEEIQLFKREFER
jgi:hypothetical protein